MRQSLTIVALLLLPTTAFGQLPFQLAPVGTLRIGLHGEFAPAFREIADGKRRSLGSPVSVAPGQPLLGDLQDRLGAILGTTSSAGSMGTLGAELEYQRGTGTIELAAGITRRLTVGLALPIVSIRTQSSFTASAQDATVGLNPVLRGDPGSEMYLSQLGAALGELKARVETGAYDGDQAVKDAAVSLLAEGPVLQTQLAALLTDSVTASAVLPLSTSPEGIALLGRTNSLREEFAHRFGISGFSAALSLPGTPLSDAELTSLLGARRGFDLAPSTDPPLVGLGDIRLGATALVFEKPFLRIWGEAGVRLPTGTAPRVRYLRDQGTGERQFALDAAGIVETSRGSLGLRATTRFQRGFASDREARVGSRDQVLRPASRTTLLRMTPGMRWSVDVRPYLRVAPSFALYGQLTYQRRGADAWESVSQATPISGGSISGMGAGSGASALIAGVGLSYAHTGVNKDGDVKRPVEAGLGLTRVVMSGSGIVADRLTTSIWFRVYKGIFTP